jgi:hypothetical protein
MIDDVDNNNNNNMANKYDQCNNPSLSLVLQDSMIKTANIQDREVLFTPTYALSHTYRY